jgi:hypothetical protein
MMTALLGLLARRTTRAITVEIRARRIHSVTDLRTGQTERLQMVTRDGLGRIRTTRVLSAPTSA